MSVTSFARDGVALYSDYNKMSAAFTGTTRLVVFGVTATRITSTDGTNWAATAGTTSSVNLTYPFYPITKNGRMFCQMGGNWDWSYDGNTFQSTAGYAGDANASMRAMELTATNDIAWSSFYAATRNHIMREYSGYSGNVAAAPFNTGITGIANNATTGAASTWVTTGGANTAYSTNDGVTWTLVTNATATARVQWGIDKFLAWNNLASTVGTTSYTSTNGSTWTSRTLPVAPSELVSLRFIGGQWFLGGASGALYTSPDGITWTSRTSGAGANAIYGFGYGAGFYVACGAGGYLATSPDGVTWTARTSGTTNALYLVGAI